MQTVEGEKTPLESAAVQTGINSVIFVWTLLFHHEVWLPSTAPFFRALVVYSYQVYSEQGADNVI